MASQPNPQQIAPGEEVAEENIPNAEFVGWRPTGTLGYPLNQAFSEGAVAGR
jgi:hypothetical protein